MTWQLVDSQTRWFKIVENQQINSSAVLGPAIGNRPSNWIDHMLDQDL